MYFLRLGEIFTKYLHNLNYNTIKLVVFRVIGNPRMSCFASTRTTRNVQEKKLEKYYEQTLRATYFGHVSFRRWEESIMFHHYTSVKNASYLNEKIKTKPECRTNYAL